MTRKNKDLVSTLPLTISAQHGLVDQVTFFNKQVASKDVSGYYLLKNGEFAYNKSYSKDYPWGVVKRLDMYDMGVLSTLYITFKPIIVDSDFFVSYYETNGWHKEVAMRAAEGARNHGLLNITASAFFDTELMIPSDNREQIKIGKLFVDVDKAITLQQCEQKIHKGENIMLSKMTNNNYFHVYYKQWITIYKEGAIRDVTMKKYLMALKWIEKLAPTLKLCEVNRITYQQLLNNYAIEHERVTTMDFHHLLKGAIMDAVDDGLIERDPTRKAIIKGKHPGPKKPKYLNQFELHMLLSSLELTDHINFDWLILLIAKTGIRFSEALGITPSDFDFTHQLLIINKTWDYKSEGKFLPTKNHSSIRKVQIDWQTVIQFSELIKNIPTDKPIFVERKIYNSTVNDLLERRCKAVNVPIVTIHGLRHTHASLLLFAGVSIASVARRLGHASMTTTQKTYLHIIQELENQDLDLVMRSLSGLS